MAAKQREAEDKGEQRKTRKKKSEESVFPGECLKIRFIRIITYYYVLYVLFSTENKKAGKSKGM